MDKCTILQQPATNEPYGIHEAGEDTTEDKSELPEKKYGNNG